MNYIITIIVLTLTILLLDSMMIGLVFNKNWNNNIKTIQNSPLKVKYIYAIITYVLIITGVMLFVYPKLKAENYVIEGLKWGFLWGVITYGIFDFTNLSIFKDYSLQTAIVDTLWGGILIGSSVIITYFISEKLKI